MGFQLFQPLAQEALVQVPSLIHCLGRAGLVIHMISLRINTNRTCKGDPVLRKVHAVFTENNNSDLHLVQPNHRLVN